MYSSRRQPWGCSVSTVQAQLVSTPKTTQSDIGRPRSWPTAARAAPPWVARDLVALLAQRYPEIVASTDSVKQAATASGLSESEVQAGLSAAIQPGSLNMLLTVKAPTPEQADAAVDSLYKTTLKANEGDTNIKAVAVSAPSASSTPAGVPKKILYAAVVLLAAMVAVVVALIVDQFRSEGRG